MPAHPRSQKDGPNTTRTLCADGRRVLSVRRVRMFGFTHRPTGPRVRVDVRPVAGVPKAGTDLPEPLPGEARG